MSDTRLNLDPDSCVSASELVRHFGIWQEKAIAQPVFVMRRGRPSLVLTSFDLMRRLCLHEAPPAVAPSDTLLYDSMREAVLTIDVAGRVEHGNRAARLLLGVEPRALIDRPLDQLLPPEIARFLIDQGARSRRLCCTEHSELAVGDRHFSVVVAPRPDGALVILQDDTVDTRVANSETTLRALEAAVDVMGGLATARVNLRGYVQPTSPSLSRMIGLDPALLPSVRFAALFDIASRVTVGDAIEAVLRSGTPVHVAASLTRNRAPTLPVEVALAPERGGVAIEAIGVIVMHAASDAGSDMSSIDPGRGRAE